MMAGQDPLVTLDVKEPIWSHVFIVAPLVLVGTRDVSGAHNLAPKHMAMPLGWDNYWAFVCTPRHSTYRNIQARGEFTVTFPRPNQVLLTSMAATPRTEDDVKPGMALLPTFPADEVDALFVEEGYLFLECALDRLVDGFGENSLVVGRIVAAHVRDEALRGADTDDAEILRKSPLLAYLSWGRFASVREGFVYPFPEGFER